MRKTGIFAVSNTSMNEALRTPSDFSLDQRKHLTRLRTLATVQQCPALWQNGKLLLDWMELSAKEDPTLVALQSSLGPGRFLGISREEAVIKYNLQHQPFHDLVSTGKAKFILGEMGHEISDLASYPRVGVLVFDGFTSVANPSLSQTLRPLFNFALHRARKHGQTLLVTNLVERGNRAQNKDQGTQQYKEFLARCLGFPVPKGHFDPYRGEDRNFGMLLHRILITAPGLAVPEGVTVWPLT